MKPPVSDKKIVRSVTKKTWETQKAEGDDSITLKRKKKKERKPPDAKLTIFSII